MMAQKTCYTCRYFEEDFSVGAYWCENNDTTWTDDEVEKYFENDEPGCPHWKESDDQ